MISALTRPFQRFLDPSLLSGVVVVGGMTVAVKAIAFAKELVVAHRFGVSDEVDAFLVAFMVPTFVAFMVGDAFRDALIPAYAKRRVEDGEGAGRLVSNVLWICAALLIAVSLGALLFGRPLIDLLARDFSPEKKERTVALLLLLVPFSVCFGVSSVLKGYLQSHRRFLLSSVAAAAVPASTIVVLLLAPGEPSAALLAAGASLGAFVFAVILVSASRGVRPDRRLLTRPGWDAATRSVIRQSFPLLAGAAVMEGCYFIDTMMAASLEPGSVAVLSYGGRICTIVLAIGGTAAGQVLFPHVAGLAAEKRWDALARVVSRFSAIIVLGALPFVAVFWFAAEPIVCLLFERGEFSSADTVRVAEVLRFAGFQIPGYILAVLGARVVMALNANRYLLLTTVIGLAANVGLNLLFIRWFGVKGIALSTAVVSVGTAAMLYLYFIVRVRRLVRERG